MSFTKEDLNELFNEIPDEVYLCDIQAAEQLGRDFLLINKSNYETSIFDFFQSLVRDRILGVNLGAGTYNWCTRLIGCRVDEFEERNDVKNKKILKLVQETTQKTYLNLIQPIQQFLNEESTNEVELRDYYEKCITYNKQEKSYSSVRMVIIKLFSLLFPEYFIPIFHKDEYRRYLGLFVKKLTKKQAYEYFSRGGKLLECLNDRFEPDPKKNHRYVHFLYFQGGFLENSNIKKNLAEIGFKGYPSEEQSVVGLFYKLIMSEKSLGSMDKFKGFTTYLLRTAYPDLIGHFFGNEEPISIEFEYDAKGYERHLGDPTAADYIICWRNDENKKVGDFKHKKTKKYPKEIIVLKEVLDKVNLNEKGV